MSKILKNIIGEELGKIRFPNIPGGKLLEKEEVKKLFHKGKSIPNREVCHELTTSRNRELISVSEQKKLGKITVAFFGMSVGSHAALTWMMESRADVIKIVDPDIISPTNLNRLRFGWGSVGKKKIDVVESMLKDMNPYVKVVSSYLADPKSMRKIIFSDPTPDVIVDEIDSFEGKIELRRAAKKLKIPLVSAADIGDNIVLDIERYDKDDDLQFFLGRIPDVERINFGKMGSLEKKKLIIKLVGFEHNSESMLGSILSLGKTISTWPQLGATATISGGLITTVIKKIVLDEDVKSGRYYLSLDNLLVADFDSVIRKKTRQDLIKQLQSG